MQHNRTLFIQTPDKYHRHLDVLEESVKTYAHYFHIKSGKPIALCEDYIRNQIKEGAKFELKPITLTGLKQDENGDRVLSSVRFDRFIGILKRRRHILTPNLAVYNHPAVKMSPLVKYIKLKKAGRNVVKKRGQQAEQLGDYGEFSMCNNLEYAIKVLINSLSGSHASMYTPLWNESAHSTLTSISRVYVSYSNASTERFLMGNRHYWSKDVVLENILTITRNTDYVALGKLVTKYKLHVPTADEVLSSITRSTQFYWQSTAQLNIIKDLVSKLSDLQRVAFIYTGDFYNLYTFNDTLAKNLIDNITDVKDRLAHYPEADLDQIVYKAATGTASLASIYCKSFLKGTTIHKVKENSPENYRVYANTILHIELALLEYEDLLTVLFRTENLPSTIYNYPNSIRRCVIGSDTDSVMYTVQQQVIWRYGRLILDDSVDPFSTTISYLNNLVVDHSLIVVGKQMGVADEELQTLQMKNEFEFPVYFKANRAKHYATLMSAKEGLAFSKLRSEIKGVGLKDSKIPKFVMHSLDKELILAMTEVIETGKLKAFPILQKIANFEHVIIQSLLRGEITYLVTVNINHKDGYKNPNSSNYLHHELWDEVFAKTFGKNAAPPYRAVKISTIVGKKNLFKNWIQTVDSSISEPLLNFMKERGKDSFVQLLLPLEIVGGGIPELFISALDIKRTVADISAGYYILLEMMGFYFNNKPFNTQLVSDRMSYKPEFGLPGGTAIEDIILADDDDEDAILEDENGEGVEELEEL